MTHHSVRIATLAVAAAAGISGLALAQPSNARIDWKIDRTAAPSSVQLTVDWRTKGGRNVWSNNQRTADLIGFDQARLKGPGGPVRFAILRPAGRLSCAGNGSNGRGAGTCVFSPDADFAGLVAAQGMDRPTWQQSLSLAMSNVDRPLVQSMALLRGMQPTVQQLVSMGVHGVSSPFISAIARSRLPLRSVNDIVSLRIHGADTAWVEGVGRYAPQLRHLSGGALVSLRIHGAEPDWIGAMAAAMGPRFSTVTGSELTSMQIHGARPDVVAAYVRTFGSKISGGDITSMAIHGVTPEFIRRVAAQGHRDVSPGQLVSWRINGLPNERRASR